MTTTATQRQATRGLAIAVRRAYREATDCRDLRRRLQALGVLRSGLRCEGWYRYHHNGGICSERRPSAVARVTRELAGGSTVGVPATWCRTWRRTQASLAAEQAGDSLYAGYARQVRTLPVVTLRERLAQYLAR